MSESTALNDTRTTQLANCILVRILWHMASECDDYEKVTASLPDAMTHTNQLNARNSVVFNRLLCLDGADIFDLSNSIDSLVTEYAGGDMFKLSQTKKLPLSRDISLYLRECGYPIESKVIFDILGEEMQKMAQKCGVTPIVARTP